MFSATAYHWISQAQTDRPAGLIRPGGVLAIVERFDGHITRPLVATLTIARRR